MKNYDVRWDNEKHLEALERRRMKELDREKQSYWKSLEEDEEDETSENGQSVEQERDKKRKRD